MNDTARPAGSIQCRHRRGAGYRAQDWRATRPGRCASWYLVVTRVGRSSWTTLSSIERPRWVGSGHLPCPQHLRLGSSAFGRYLMLQRRTRGRRGYINRAKADVMAAIGSRIRSASHPERDTGDCCLHNVVHDGAFDCVARAFLATLETENQRFRALGQWLPEPGRGGQRLGRAPSPALRHPRQRRAAGSADAARQAGIPDPANPATYRKRRTHQNEVPVPDLQRPRAGRPGIRLSATTTGS